MPDLNESIAEDSALEWFVELGYVARHEPQMALCNPVVERNVVGAAFLVERLRQGSPINVRHQSRTLAILRLSPPITPDFKA